MPVSRKELANAIRFLSMDAVEKANSGHPGMPMGMADIAQVLWGDFLKHNPKNPSWINRDRFILSNGHGSMLLYSLLHLTGYDVNLEDLKNFRQLHSRTPGHPEYGELPGVETTTGPLGQGLANAVGMAIAEQVLGSKFNKPGFNIVDNYTYCFAGDGCLMEGISHEVCSFAGTLGLGKLIVFWDNNDVSIDGKVSPWFSEDVAKRFSAYNWHVVANVDGHNPEEIKNAIIAAQNNKDKPSIICCRTIIGFGAPTLSGTAKTHGSPLGKEEIIATRKALNWKYKEFEIPQEIYNSWDSRKKGEELEAEWHQLFENYKNEYPDLAVEFERRINGKLPENLTFLINEHIKNIKSEDNIATRKASENALNVISKIIPELIGGSADLTESNLTKFTTAKVIAPHEISGNYIYYGVREFGMAAIMNGIALYRGLIPYGGTFLVFSDYARNAIRLGCLMKQRVIYVLTHDSIGLGEDGPTHQPIEHLSSLRLIPGMSLWRPADETETFIAWQEAIIRTNGPTILSLTRQKVRNFKRTEQQIKNINKGAYSLYLSADDALENLDINIIATGSEVEIAIDAADLLGQSGYKVQVVSMPNCAVFDQQDELYKSTIIPNNVATVAIEAASKDYWYKYVDKSGLIIGLNEFGRSAPYKDIYKDLGFTKEAIANEIKSWFKARGN